VSRVRVSEKPLTVFTTPSFVRFWFSRGSDSVSDSLADASETLITFPHSKHLIAGSKHGLLQIRFQVGNFRTQGEGYECFSHSDTFSHTGILSSHVHWSTLYGAFTQPSHARVRPNGKVLFVRVS
jgi:hypothetical protein